MVKFITKMTSMVPNDDKKTCNICSVSQGGIREYITPGD